MKIFLIICCFFLIFYSIGMTILANYAWNLGKRRCNELEAKNDLMMYWLQKKMEGIDIKEFLSSRKYKSLAFYKFTPICEMLIMELSKYAEVLYCLDESADTIWDEPDDVPVIKPSDLELQKKVDLMIISETKEDKQLIDNLSKYGYKGEVVWACEIIKEL